MATDKQVEELFKKYTDEERREKLKQIYGKIKKILSKYMDMEEKNKEVIALWIIGTYLHDNFETFPYLFLNAMRGSGKTRALKIITKLANKGNILISLTEAALFRSEGTLGVDEFEGLGSKDKQSLRELLNAGYKKGIGVVRMKKEKTLNGEEIVPERFECYRPIVMANIWGMEEVLGDRCITIILEKSNNPLFTRLIEDFEQNPLFEEVKGLFGDVCEVTFLKKTSITSQWNKFIMSHTSLTSQTPQTTQTSPQQDNLQKIYDTNIDGRNLELYFPLMEIAQIIGQDVFDDFLKIASESVESRRIDEIAESKDVSMYQMVAALEDNKYYKIKELVESYRFLLGEGATNYDWLNTRWLGRAVKRLNLITSKRKVRDGSEVMLNTNKAKEKLEMFK